MNDSRYIDGIFNYCDYWCDRCAFTRRCRTFAMEHEFEREEQDESADKDATNAAFWSRLAEKVRETKVVTQATEWPATEWTDGAAADIDLAPDPEWQARRDRRRQAVKRHPLVLMAQEYMTRTHAWLKRANDDLKVVAQELLEAAGSRFADGDYEEEALAIGEMIEVVAWYHTLITPKLARAVNGLTEREDEDGEVAEILAQSRHRDANGSGKIALVAIERSCAAWVRLREILPGHEDEILAMLALLSRLRRGIHAALPGAQAFKRPGFDGVDTEDADHA